MKVTLTHHHLHNQASSEEFGAFNITCLASFLCKTTHFVNCPDSMVFLNIQIVWKKNNNKKLEP